jgi:TonB family protein
MFSNLIESSSHAKEFKRRGSFLLFTTATYVVLFVITGVVSIYAYDTHLEQQNLEIVAMLSPQEIVPEGPEPIRPIERPRVTRDNSRSEVPERTIAMLSVNHPEVVPDKVSSERNTVPPLPPGPVRITDRNWDPPPIGGGGTNNGGRQIVQPSRVVIDDDPPPAPAPVVPKIVKVSQQVLTSKALSLPKPPYPQMAKLSHIQGTVTVQVLIDETGKVISAKALSGHVLLIPDAQRAALQARFSPTTIGGVSVKVSGMIAYNFVLP